jgi:hypothetical protein
MCLYITEHYLFISANLVAWCITIWRSLEQASQAPRTWVSRKQSEQISSTLVLQVHLKKCLIKQRICATCRVQRVTMAQTVNWMMPATINHVKMTERVPKPETVNLNVPASQGTRARPVKISWMSALLTPATKEHARRVERPTAVPAPIRKLMFDDSVVWQAYVSGYKILHKLPSINIKCPMKIRWLIKINLWFQFRAILSFKSG